MCSSRCRNVAVLLGSMLCNLAVAQLNTDVAADAASVQSFFGTVSVKVVFVVDGKLYYVDFEEADPAVHIFTAPQIRSVDNPCISPDGQWVTFSTGAGGQTGTKPADAWVCAIASGAQPVKIVSDSGYNPRFMMNAPALTVVYSTNSERDSWNGKGAIRAVRIINNQPVGDSLIYAGGGFNGGLSYDNKYLANANTGDCRMLDLENVSAGTWLLHQIYSINAVSGERVDASVQTCNASISSSRIFTNYIMYLDFGCSTIPKGNYHPILGRSWPQHDRIFIASAPDGAFHKFIFPPSEIPVDDPSTSPGKGEIVGLLMERPEWSNHPYYATGIVACDRLFETSDGWDNQRFFEKIYAFNIKDGTSLRLIQSADTTHDRNTFHDYPWLWVDVADGFTEDPAWLAATVETLQIDTSVDSVRVAPSVATLETIGATTALSVSVYPSSVTDKRVLWSAVDPAVAAVSETGVVTAIAAGETDIVVTSVKYPQIQDTCKITVSVAIAPAPVPEKKGGCGSGFILAFIIPVVLKGRTVIKRKIK